MATVALNLSNRVQYKVVLKYLIFNRVEKECED
jgi:hypothetical protein